MEAEVSLRALEKEDLPFLHRLFNDVEIMAFWFEEPYCTFNQLEKFYQKHEGRKQARQFILTKENEQIGYVGLFSISSIHRNAEFGIIIDPKYQGNGYGMVGCRLAIDYSFSTLNLHKLYLLVDQENKHAIHLYKKVGFQVEGVLKEKFFVNGTYRDALYMSIFKRDML